jgi:tetratricopeptide (TPR) repeat protein
MISPKMISFKKLSAIVVALALAGLGGWYAWRAWTTPAPPSIALAPDADPEVIELVGEHVAEVKRAPRSGKTWGKLGQVLRAHAYHAEANRCFEIAARLDPAEPRWPYLHGAQLLFGNPAAATPLLREAVRRCRSKDELYKAAALRLAEALIEAGELQEAEVLLHEALRLEPGSPRVAFDLGLLAAARSQWSAGLVHFTMAQNDPRCRQKALLQRAGVLRRQGKDDEAEEVRSLAQRLPHDPGWPDPFMDEYRALVVGKLGTLRRAERLEHEGRIHEALTILRGLAQAHADDAAFLTLGSALLRAGRPGEAEPVLRRSVELAPTKAPGLYLLSYALCVQGERLIEQGDKERAGQRLSEALVYADRAIALNPQHALPHLFRGIALKRLGRTDDAVTSLRTAILARPEFADAHRYLGEILAERGDVAEAIPYLENAVRFARPEDPRPKQALARWRK